MNFYLMQHVVDIFLDSGKYPGGDSLVAPGMCSRFNVRFLPDSLADYEDEIQILSQVGSPLVVKIKAQRQPPILTSMLGIILS